MWDDDIGVISYRRDFRHARWIGVASDCCGKHRKLASQVDT